MVSSQAGPIAGERLSRQPEGSPAMQATARTSRFSWWFVMIIGIATIALGSSSADAGASTTISAVPRPADSVRADSDDRIANALFGDESSRVGIRQPVAVPSLTDVSATTQTARLFTVTGTDFTAGWPRLPRHLRPDGSPALRDPLDHRQPSPVGTHGADRSRGSIHPWAWPRRHAPRGVHEPLRGDGDDAGLRPRPRLPGATG